MTKWTVPRFNASDIYTSLSFQESSIRSGAWWKCYNKISFSFWHGFAHNPILEGRILLRCIEMHVMLHNLVCSVIWIFSSWTAKLVFPKACRCLWLDWIRLSDLLRVWSRFKLIQTTESRKLEIITKKDVVW